MEYTKRDLELVQILRDNFERWMENGSSEGICDCIIDMQFLLDIPYTDCNNLKYIIREAFREINPTYLDGIGIWMWKRGEIEPRKQFLNDLITKIKNSLST